MPYTTYVPPTDYQGKQLVPVRLHPISEPRVVGQQGTTLPQSAIPPYGQLFPPTRWFTDIVVPPIVYDEAVLFGTFPAATVGTPYVYDLFLAGGDGSWSNPRAIVGVLPTWATLSIVGSPGAYRLRLSGTPTGDATTVAITAAADSGDGQTAISAQSFEVIVVVSYTTLNPSDKASTVTLSGGNLTATGTTASSGLARSIKPITGKKYFEIAIVDSPGGLSFSVAGGVCNNSESVTSSCGYADANGWAAWGATSSSGMRHNGITIWPEGAVVGDVIGVAVDEPNHRMWMKIHGAWVNSGDPAEGTNPLWADLSGTLYAAACPWSAGAKVTMRFDPATFTETIPAGFEPITA